MKIATNLKNTLIAATSAVFFCTPAFAAPAMPGLIEFQQADGSTVTGELHGDEFFNYRTTEDGYVMVQDENGYFEYADPDSAQLVPSGVRVDAPQLRSTAAPVGLTPGLTPAQQAKARQTFEQNRAAHAAIMKDVPVAPHNAGQTNGLRAANHSGNLKFIVLLIEFQDKFFTYGHDDFYNLLNQENWGGTGSTRDFYRHSSWDLFQPTFDVWGPIRVDMTAHEAKQDTPTMIYQACQKADALGANFADYDTDNDGNVDNVYCFFAGYDQAQGGSEYDCIWSHASGIGYKGLRLDGKLVSGYGCSSELKWSSGADRVNIGTFTHEFGHVIGLPDFYITGGDGGHSPGGWDTMAGGCYNNDSKSPPLFSAYERELLGWCTIPVVPEGQVTLPNLQDNRNLPAYRIQTNNPQESYIVEYRVKTQYQNYGLPRNGMMIWHVDHSLDGWNHNNPNGIDGHPGYDVFECNNYNTYADVSKRDAEFSNNVMWPFGGRNGVNLYGWNGNACGSLTAITDHNTYATFNVGETFSCLTEANPAATFYADINYGGDAYGLPEGNYTLSDLARYCMPDDWLSSFRVKPGYKVTLYKDDNFTGESATYTADNNWVGNNWNDAVTSIKIEPNGVAGMTGVWKLKNRNSGKYLDCDGNGTGNGTKVVQWDDEGEEAYQQWQFREVATGVYTIVQASTANQVIDISGNGTANQTGAVLWTSSGGRNQQFILYQIEPGYYQLIARHCGKPLEFYGASTESGAQTNIYDNNGSACQQWQLERNIAPGCKVANFYADCNYNGYQTDLAEGAYTMWQLKLYNIGDDNLSSLKTRPGFTTTLYADDNQTGTSLELTGDIACLTAYGLGNGNFNDQTTSLKIEARGVSGLSGTYLVKAHNNDLYWGIAGGSANPSTDLQQQALNATDAQLFTLSEWGNSGVYTITNVKSGMVLDIWEASCENRADIRQGAYNGDPNQQFIAVDKGNGYYQFVARNSGKVIEVPNNSATANEALKTWDNNNQTCSYWSLETPDYNRWVISRDEIEPTDRDLRWNEVYPWEGTVTAAQAGNPFEGAGNIAFTTHSDLGWWGFGIHNVHQTVDFAPIADWALHFAVKTTVTDPMDVRMTTESGEYNVSLNNGYGVRADNQWHEVIIPLVEWSRLGMSFGTATNNVMFSLVCGEAGAGSNNKNLEVDDIYFYPLPENVYGYDLTDNGGRLASATPGLTTFNDESVSKVIDNSAATKYCTNPAGEIWIRYSSTQSAILYAYSITSANDFADRDPKSWSLYGSNDNVNWTLLDARENQIFPLRFQRKYYTITGNTQSFGIYKWVVTAQAGQNQTVFQVAEWELFGQETGPFNPMTSVGQSTENGQLHWYPNPVKDHLTIEGTTKGCLIEIFDTTGRKCMQMESEDNSTTLHLDGLAQGNYLVRMGTVVFKLIK